MIVRFKTKLKWQVFSCVVIFVLVLRAEPRVRTGPFMYVQERTFGQIVFFVNSVSGES